MHGSCSAAHVSSRWPRGVSSAHGLSCATAPPEGSSMQAWSGSDQARLVVEDMRTKAEAEAARMLDRLSDGEIIYHNRATEDQ